VPENLGLSRAPTCSNTLCSIALRIL